MDQVGATGKLVSSLLSNHNYFYSTYPISNFGSYLIHFTIIRCQFQPQQSIHLQVQVQAQPQLQLAIHQRFYLYLQFHFLYQGLDSHHGTQILKEYLKRPPS